MGFGSKIKKATKKASSTAKKTTTVVKKVSATAAKAKTVASNVKTVASSTKDVLNNPLVQTGLTIGATALAGPSGAQMVQTGYSVMNTEGNILDKALAAASASGVPLNIAGNIPSQAVSAGSAESEIVYEYDTSGSRKVDSAGFSNIAYSSNPAAGAVNALTQSFFEKHKTKIIVGVGAIGLFVAYKMLGGKKKKRR